MRAAILDIRVRFLAAIALWSAALLVMLRSPLGERAIVAPFAAWHAAMAFGVSGGSPVTVDLSCSGSDVIAVSMAAILAYPVAWRRRFWGLALAALWLSGLNLVRIITLVNTAGTPAFLPLHLYVWPGLMIAAAAAFVFHWMWAGDRTESIADPDVTRRWRFVIATAMLVVAYVAASPWLLRSLSLQSAAIRFANAAAAMLRGVGMTALTGGSTLVVGDRAFLITPECIVTPLMPVYLAWASTWLLTWRARVTAVAAFVPLFAGLSVLRLLTVALPAVIGPPLFLTHGFYQFVVGLLLVTIAARWRTHDQPVSTTFRVLAGAVLIAAAIAVGIARPHVWLVEAIRDAVAGLAPHALSALPSTTDVQGALAILPVYQLGLLIALTLALLGRAAWRVLMVLVPITVLLQVITLVVLGETAAHLSIDLPAVFVRLVAIGTPAVLVMLAAIFLPRRRVRQWA